MQNDKLKIKKFIVRTQLKISDLGLRLSFYSDLTWNITKDSIGRNYLQIISTAA